MTCLVVEVGAQALPVIMFSITVSREVASLLFVKNHQKPILATLPADLHLLRPSPEFVPATKPNFSKPILLWGILLPQIAVLVYVDLAMH